MISIHENIKSLLEEVKEICDSVGRNAEDIKIIAVSKTFPSEYVKNAYESGIRDFGENYVQELRKKMEELKDLEINWHFIGRIQTNKIKYIVGKVELIHSVYREKELIEIDKRAKSKNIIQDVLIEVNLSGEESKGGIEPDKIFDLIETAKNYSNVKIKGLMTMAPYTDDWDLIRRIFQRLRELRDELKKYNPEIRELSMGMSNDYKIAIEEGATILRIGTRIFGRRKG